MLPYGDPVLYDILHTPGTAAELEALGRIALRHGLGPWAGLNCLEPACGTGRLLRLLCRRRARLHGFDCNADMLAYARSRLPPALSRRLFLASMQVFAQHLRPSSIDLAFTTINSIRHLGSDAELLAHLQQMRQVLRPRGRYIIGISLSQYDVEAPSEDLWQSRRGRCHVAQLVQYLPPEDGSRVETVISHVVARRPTGEEHHTESYELRCYDEAQWHRCLAQSGFTMSEQCDDRGFPMPLARGAYRLCVLSLDDAPPR